MNKFFALFIIVIVLAGCPNPGDPGNNDTRTLWSGEFRVELYGGGAEKSYDIVMEGKDNLFYSLEEDAFFILVEEFYCQYLEESHIPETEYTPPIDQVRIGTGTYSKEYYDSEHPTRMAFYTNSISLNLSENEDNWVTFTNTFNGESMIEHGGCLIDQLYNVVFDEDEYNFPWVDNQGRDAITGSKTITEGSANLTISFEYHRVTP